MKALVTGATGFVGAHLVRALTHAGHSVRALHRDSSRLDALVGLSYESALGDVTDRDSLDRACAGCDWVFHVAAVADYWRADVNRMYAVNVEGTENVLAAAASQGVRRVVFTSSAAAVGSRLDGQPADELIPFDLPPERFPYGHSKVLAEESVMDAMAGGQDVVIVNPVVILGPGDLNIISGDIVLKVRRLGWTIPVPPGGVAVIDVRDVARLHIAAAERGRSGERYILGAYNVKHAALFEVSARIAGVAAPGLPIPRAALAPLAEAIEALRVFGVPVPVDGNQTRLGGRDIYFDFGKMRRELGEAEIDWRQSLSETFAWYRDNGYIRDDTTSRLIAAIGRWL
ncbi:MAG: NAD-dependent epimerase/dehydratase family protein [Chloroflexota bacterium]|nr:NAD-dependent epimerase/dehydratase family protein [Chloroflexota bacterium]